MNTGIISSHQDIDLSETSGNGPLYTFQSCTFYSLVYSESGGAISCIASSSDYYQPQLTIKECLFTSCKSSSGYGGRIYAEGLSSFAVKHTLIFDCHSTTKNGGGLVFSSSVGFPLLSEISFISCYARNYYSSADSADDGGGLFISSSAASTELHYIIQGCRFISCGCYDWGGGCFLGVSYSVVGCTDSLFASGKSNNAAAIGIHNDDSQANTLIYFCYFCYNIASQIPSDININRHAGTFSSSPIIHSFSTKDPSRSVYLYYQWAGYEYRNWLPQTKIDSKFTGA